MNNRIYRLMLKAFDAPLRTAELKVLENSLEDSPELRSNQKIFQCLRQALSSASYTSFGPAFVQRVVAVAYSAYDEFEHWLRVSFERTAIVALGLAIACAYYSLSVHGSADIAELFGQPGPSIDRLVEVWRVFK
jgi:hypothetical protein